jgi:hypothetical protein
MKFLEEYLKTFDSDMSMEGSQPMFRKSTEQNKSIPNSETYCDCGEYCLEDFGM